jgi:hypothetical protein
MQIEKQIPLSDFLYGKHIFSPLIKDEEEEIEEDEDESTENDSYGQPLDSDHEWWDQFYTDEEELQRRQQARQK